MNGNRTVYSSLTTTEISNGSDSPHDRRGTRRCRAGVVLVHYGDGSALCLGYRIGSLSPWPQLATLPTSGQVVPASQDD